MSKESVITVYTIGFRNIRGTGKHGVYAITASKKEALEAIGICLDRKEEPYLKYEEMTLEQYVSHNYENMSESEIIELQNKYDVEISWYKCENI